MRPLVALLAMLLVGVGVGACSHRPVVPDGGCPSGATHGVVWSSLYSESRLQVFRQSELLWETGIPVKGLVPSRGMEPVGDRFVAVSHGDQRRVETHIVTFDPGSCEVKVTPIAAQYLYQWNADDDSVYVLDTLNFVAQLSRYSLEGAQLGSARFKGELAVSVVADGDDVFLISEKAESLSDPESGSAEVYLRQLDRATMRVKSEKKLPTSTVGGANPVIVGEKLLFSDSSDESATRETGELYSVNKRTGHVEQLELPATAPLGFARDTAGDRGRLFLAHAAINPAFRPHSEYRNVTVIDTETLAMRVLTLQRGVNEVSVRNGLIFTEGNHGDEDQEWHVDVYSDDGTLRYQQDLDLPRGMQTPYVSAVLALG